MKVLVTGGAGYIGAVLCRQLLQAGHQVRVVDALHWGREPLSGLDVEIVEGDIREFDDRWLAGVDAVAHLAGLSNDPTADFDPALNEAVNYRGTCAVADACAHKRIARFTFASSASIYDGAGTDVLDERVEVAPVGGYSITKYAGERALERVTMTRPWFRPVILRQGTVFGASPRMRFDLVVNAFVRAAIVKGHLDVHGGGNNWRPIVDVEHVAAAHVAALSADPELVAGTYNVVDENVQIRTLADRVATLAEIHGSHVSVSGVASPPDRRVRDYQVSGERFNKVFGRIRHRSFYDAVSEMFDACYRYDPSDLYAPQYENIAHMKLRVERSSAA